MTRDARGKPEYDSDSPADTDGFREYLTKQKPLAPGVSLLAIEDMDDWQFLRLNPDVLGQPKAQTLATNRVRLATDGSNIAEYLNEIRELNLNAFEGILQSLSYVLPYASDLQPDMTSELERTFYLNLIEGEFKVPGWLLSTGTLRIVSILACLRHPNPPPLLVIEEVENGLDPRTLKLVVEEIRAAIAERKTQVIITTHSPFLLDLLDLSHVIVVDRVNGEPKFTRPDKDELASWSSSFGPGRLYTMGRLTKD
jgi:predicted ATPase